LKTTTLSARFLAGFEPSVLPPRGPDGMIPSGPAKMLPVLDPPSLCEAGPCRHYHRVRSVMDVEDGGHGGPMRTQVTRACYPTHGIEIDLGETPVLQCSRWEPDNEQARLESIRQAFLKGGDGKAFAAKMNAFEQANEAARVAEDEVLEGDKPDPNGQAEADAAVEQLLARNPAINTDENGKPYAAVDEIVAKPSSGFDVSDDDLDALIDEAEGEVTP
jgi:hypothetical protein